jgi:hypothetical protein
MHVRVVAEGAGPGMESPHQRDPAADASGVQSQCLEGRGRSPQEQAGHGLWVAASQRSQYLREGEGDQARRDWQQHTLLVFQPLLGVRIVARGTRPVLTRVGAIMIVSAWLTMGHLPAQTLRATLLNVLHGSQVCGWHLGAEWSAVVGAMAAEDVHAFEHGKTPKEKASERP